MGETLHVKHAPPPKVGHSLPLQQEGVDPDEREDPPNIRRSIEAQHWPSVASSLKAQENHEPQRQAVAAALVLVVVECPLHSDDGVTGHGRGGWGRQGNEGLGRRSPV